MAEVPTPPKPPSPKDAAGGAKAGLKKVPKWGWYAMGVVFVGVLYLTLRNRSVTDEQPLDQGMDDPTADVYPAPTQGAYSGGDYPTSDGGGTSYDGGQAGLDTAMQLVSWLDQRDADRAAWYTTGPEPTPGDSGASPTTGGGPPGRTVTTHLAKPKNVTKNGKFYHVYNYGKSNEKWVYIRPASQTTPTPARGTTTPHATQQGGSGGAAQSREVAPKGYPHKGPHGWYRQERDKKGPYHLYQNGTKVRV
jgi:hypothetical protein